MISKPTLFLNYNYLLNIELMVAISNDSKNSVFLNSAVINCVSGSSS